MKTVVYIKLLRLFPEMNSPKKTAFESGSNNINAIIQISIHGFLVFNPIIS